VRGRQERRREEQAASSQGFCHGSVYTGNEDIGYGYGRGYRYATMALLQGHYKSFVNREKGNREGTCMGNTKRVASRPLTLFLLGVVGMDTERNGGTISTELTTWCLFFLIFIFLCHV